MEKSMKTLLLDIETAPNKAYVWGLFRQNVALNQLEASSYTLCWSAVWAGWSKADLPSHIEFASVQRRGTRKMLKRIHHLLNEADAVVHYNGQKFDIPTLNKEFVRHGMIPPSPYKQIDLMRVCKQAFRFESNKLAFVAKALGLEEKVKHEGFTLWVKCMNGDPQAWSDMERYNRGDVVTLADLYERLRPWITHHPNLSAHADVDCCPKCGSTEFQGRGKVMTLTLWYRRYQCRKCGGWFRGTKTVSTRKQRMVNV